MRPLTVPLLAVVAVALLTTACSGIGEFRADQLSIVAPDELSSVQLQVTVQWNGDHLPPSVSQYAVFVDRSPMSPGDDVRSLVDDACRHRRGCPDDAYLHLRGIYLTPNLSLVLPTLQSAGGLNAETARPVHEATVVALDQQGRRVGEFSATARFRFER
jgi:hypothetical protein